MKNKLLLCCFLWSCFYLSSLFSAFGQGSGSAIQLNGTTAYLQSAEDPNVVASSNNLRMEGWFKFDEVTKTVFLIDVANDESASTAPAFPNIAATPPFRTQKALWWSGAAGALNAPANHFVVTFRDNSGLFNNANACGLVTENRGIFWDFYFPFTLLPNVWYHLSAIINDDGTGNVSTQMLVNGIALASSTNILRTLPSGVGAGPCPTTTTNNAIAASTTPSINIGGGVVAAGNYAVIGTGNVETNVFVGMRPEELSTINVYPGTGVFLFKGQIDHLRLEGFFRSQADVQTDMCKNSVTNFMTFTFDDDPTLVNDAGLAIGFDDTGTLATKTPLAIVGGVTRVLSGAPIGDASAFVYGGTTTNRPYSSGNFQVTATANTPVMHVYSVAASPNNTTVPAQMGNIDTQYFGVFTGTDNITYTATYNHGGTAMLPNPPNPSSAPLALAVARRLRNDGGAFTYDATGVAAATTHSVAGLTMDLAAITPRNQQEFIYGAVLVPVLGPVGGLGADLPYAEAAAGDFTNNPTIIVANTITVTGTNITSATVQITTNFQTGDVLATVGALPAGITSSFSGSTLTITGTGTAAQYQAILQAVTYRHNTDNPTANTRTVTFTAFNGALSSNTLTRNIVVATANDRPVISGTATPLTYLKLAPAISVAPAIAVADLDDANLTQAVITIANFIVAQDEFKFAIPLPAGITSAQVNGAGIATAGTITFVGTASRATYATLLASLTYRNTSATPAPATRTVDFEVTDNGYGTAIMANFLANTPKPQVVINIDASVNVAPILTGGCPAAARDFTENMLPLSVSLFPANPTVTDADDTDLSQVEFKFTAGYSNGQDELFYDGMLPGTFTLTAFNPATGVLLISGVNTIANYMAIMQNIKYRNTNIENPTGGNRTVAVTFSDNGFTSGTPAQIKTTIPCNITVNVVPINDAPTLATIGAVTVTYTEQTVLGTVLVDNMVAITDVDNTTMASATAQITTNYLNAEDVLEYSPAVAGITAAWNVLTGTLTLGGTASITNYQIALQSIRYRNSSKNPNTLTRTVSFQVNDGQGINNLTNILTRNVNVTPVNDAPVLAAIEVPNLGYTEFEAAKQISNTITVNDVDNTTLVSATISISGGFAEDVLNFTPIGGNPITNGGFVGGVLTLNGVATLAQYQAALRSITYNNTSRNPNTTVRTVSFVVNDGSAVVPTNLNSNATTRQIGITAVNDVPTATNTSGLQTYTENEAAKVIFLTPANFAVADVDNANLASATVQITGNYFANQDVLAFTNTLGITGSWNVASGTLTLTGSSLVANYETAIRSVTYFNTSENPSGLARTLSIVVNDGLLNGTAVIQLINVIPVNDAPVASNFTNRIGVNTMLNLNNFLFLQNYTDVESDVMQSISITTLPSKGRLMQNGVSVTVGQVITSGSIALTYTPDRNYEGNDSFEWTASDGALSSNIARANIVIGVSGIYPPINLKAKAGSMQVFLSWEPVIVAGVNIVYEIYIFSANQPQKLVGTTDEEKFTVIGLENTVTYVFRVLAKDDLGRTSDFSDPVSARPSIILGTEDADLASLNFTLYPNPATGSFALMFEEKGSKKAQILIFNAVGQKVFGREIQSNSGRYEEKIDVATFAEGTYILHINSGTNSYQRRFVVQK